MSLLERELAASRQQWPEIRKLRRFDVWQNVECPIPDLAHTSRIGMKHQDAEFATGFLDSGLLDLRCALNIFEVYCDGLTTGMRPRMLDFGCGCGRLTRHVPVHQIDESFGCDVDLKNVQWCQTNLPDQTFYHISPEGRTMFNDSAFDLIYSFSVFTHLDERLQDFWLQELNRICSGLMVLSVHGGYFVSQSAPWMQNEVDWKERGFSVSERDNPDISDAVPAGYYRDVAHSAAYIKKHWSQFVDVLDIIPGGFGKLHDAVVCRKKV
jgi:SAM-dependent methyltransferase